jgi:predicted dehydrogenase
MGRGHALALAQLGAYDLVALCDLHEVTAREAAERVTAAGAPTPRIVTDYAALLAEAAPELVVVATPTALHCAHTCQAIEAGARAVCCEKPMAVHLGDARAMVELAQERGVTLIVNHQRRVQADLLEARRRIDAGAIGELQVLRAHCAGDLLTDGTHALDSLLWLAGDPEVVWAFGQVHREFPDQPLSGHTEPGVRQGHLVEAGALAVLQLASGPRIELFCGDLRERGRVYQDYEAIGATGRLWRTDDASDPNLFIADGEGGDLVAGYDGGRYRPVASPSGQGVWRAVVGAAPGGGIAESYRRLAASLATGAPHPLGAGNALRSFEALTAIHESARTHAKVCLPLTQERYPLELLVEAGAV